MEAIVCEAADGYCGSDRGTFAHSGHHCFSGAAVTDRIAGEPSFFAQKRVGKNGRFFQIYKFRSMYRDAEARKAELADQNEMKGLMFKMKDDPRITKVGKFIRKTSIDELPQFFNVLKGDMSLVGTETADGR